MARKNVYNIFQKEEYSEDINKHNKKVIEEYKLELKAANKADTTILQYINDLKIFAFYVYENCNNTEFYNVTKKQVRNFMLKMQDKDVSPARLNRVLSTLRTFYSFAIDDEDYEDFYINNPVEKIKGLKVQKVRDIEFLTREEIDTLYDYLMKEHLYQDALLLALLIDTAGRRNEIYQINKSSIKPDGVFTNFVVGKGGKKFELMYNDLTRKTFKAYLKQRGRDKEEFLWYKKERNGKVKEVPIGTMYSWVKRWNKYLENITGKEYLFNIHSFRHTTLELLSTGNHYICDKNDGQKFNLEVLQALANHNDVSTTSSYLKEKKKDVLLQAFMPK